MSVSKILNSAQRRSKGRGKHKKRWKYNVKNRPKGRNTRSENGDKKEQNKKDEDG